MTDDDFSQFQQAFGSFARNALLSLKVGQSVDLGTIPAGSTISKAEDGSILATAPDGSAQRFYLTKYGPVPEYFKPLNLHVGKVVEHRDDPPAKS